MILSFKYNHKQNFAIFVIWTHVYLWRIHFDIWQNQYNIVKLKNKIKLKKEKRKAHVMYLCLLKHYLQQPGQGRKLNVHSQMNG